MVTHVHKLRIPARAALASALLACVLMACRGGSFQGFPAARGDSAPIWPANSAAPRVAWVMQIKSHEDLFTEGGGLRTIARWFAGQPDSRMVRPFAVALHPAGGLLVADPGRACVHFYDWADRRYVAIGADRKDGLPSPVGVAALPDGRVLVSDSRLNSILIYSPRGKPLGTLAGPDVLGRPAGLAVDPAAREVYVADVTAQQVLVLDFAGNLLRRLGSRGDGPGEFNFPTHVTLTPDGLLAVTDSMNFRIELLRPDGTFVRQFGKLGDAPGRFAVPKGVAADGAGRLMVVEGRYDALQFFDNAGRLLLNVGGSGGAPGQFWLPAGVCVDRAQGLIFVADSYNGRVQVFRLLGGQPS